MSDTCVPSQRRSSVISDRGLTEFRLVNELLLVDRRQSGENHLRVSKQSLAGRPNVDDQYDQAPVRLNRPAAKPQAGASLSASGRGSPQRDGKGRGRHRDGRDISHFEGAAFCQSGSEIVAGRKMLVDPRRCRFLPQAPQPLRTSPLS